MKNKCLMSFFFISIWIGYHWLGKREGINVIQTFKKLPNMLKAFNVCLTAG